MCFILDSTAACRESNCPPCGSIAKSFKDALNYFFSSREYKAISEWVPHGNMSTCSCKPIRQNFSSPSNTLCDINAHFSVQASELCWMSLCPDQESGQVLPVILLTLFEDRG